MKAVSYDRFGGPEVLQCLDLPGLPDLTDPKPGPDQLTVTQLLNRQECHDN